MKIATFNVNGIKTRLPHLLRWLEREQPDVACLQELKALDEGFPAAEIRAAGYHPLWKGQRFPLSACISGWAMLNAQTAVIEDVFEDPRIPYDAYLPTFVKSLIMTPVGEKNVAAMGAYWRDKRKFSNLEITTVKTYSALVGKALSDLLEPQWH